MGWGVVRSLIGGAMAATFAIACTQEAPPALPSALLVVDTDVDVPRTIARLRIDVFSETGQWLHSRDYPIRRHEEWPASFGIAAPDETPVKALVRLRAYAEGAYRDYSGERYRGRQAFAAPKDPAFLRDVCRAAKELAPLQLGTMRQSDYNVTEDSCEYALYSGSTAFRITIDKPGKYRFAIIEGLPESQRSLFLRRDCETRESEITCMTHPDTFDLPRFDVDLQPGQYTLLTGDRPLFHRGLITVQWGPVAEWVEPRVPLVQTVSPVPSGTGFPRLITARGDETPLLEPEPSATIDRLVRLDLRPGAPYETRILLEGACLTRMSRVVVRDDGTVDVDKSQTCIGNKDGPIPSAEPIGSATQIPSVNGQFPTTIPCDSKNTDNQVVCVPGGSFVMGSVATDETLFFYDDRRSVPLRGTAVTRFYMDRYEVTVNRYRQAVAMGLDPGESTSRKPTENEGPLDPAKVDSSPTYSLTRRDRENHPLNRVTWDRAREVCLFFGGDLPTEAQWEYAALAAGRTRKSTYPWPSDERPTCATSVLSRTELGECVAAGPSIVPVDDPALAQDRTPLGIVGLGGNVSEYVRDADAEYDSPCWIGAAPIDPVCIDDTSPFRMLRGSDGEFFADAARGAARRRVATNFGGTHRGFRCVYREPPRRRWTGR